MFLNKDYLLLGARSFVFNTMMAGVCNFKQFPEEGLTVVKSTPLSLQFQLYTCVPELQWRGHVPAEEEGDGTSDRATGSPAIREPDTGPEKQRRGTLRSIHVHKQLSLHVPSR